MNSSLSKYKILIVDDENINIEMLVKILRIKGYSVESATNGKQALERINKKLFDLILLDIMMPGMSGFEVCKILKSNDTTKEIPVIFITALLDTNNKIKAFEMGAVDYITKPFASDEVLARINQQLTITKLQKQLFDKNTLLEQKIEERIKQLVDSNKELVESNKQILKINDELREAKERIEENEVRFRTLSENALVGIYIIEDGHFTHVNSAVVKMIGFNRKELIGADQFLIIHPNQHNLIKDNLRRLIAGEVNTIQYEFQGRCKDGSTKHFEAWESRVELYGGSVIIGNIIDITERNMAEKALEQSVSLLKATLESTADGILVVDNNGKIVTFNEKFKQMWEIPGFILADLDDKHVLDFILDQLCDPQQFLAKVEELYINSESESYDIIEFKNGRVLERFSMPQLIDGIPVGRVWSFRNVTERKKAEAALTKERNLMKALMDNTPDHIYFKDLESKFIIISKSQAERFNLPDPIKAAGKSDFDFFSEEFARPAFEDEQKIIRTGESIIDLEEKEIWPDGHLTWVSTSKMPLRNENGNIVGTFGISRPITERKLAEEAQRRSEAKFRAVVENSNDGILFGDANAIISYRSPSYTRINGYNNDERIGHNGFETVHPDDLETLRIVWSKVVQSPGIPFKAEYRISHKDGSWRWVESNMQNLINNPDVQEIVIASRDISERKEAEQELISAKEKAEESDRLKSAFLQNMSHEVRTPLNSIVGFSKLMTRQNLPPEKLKSYSDTISINSNKLLGIISDVIEISKIHANQIEANLSDVDVIQLVSEIVKSFSEKAGEKNISLVQNVNLSDNVCIISTDIEKLNKILIHLIDNAIKFTAKGTVEINSEIINENLLISISDSGIGISVEMQDVIFEPFRQVETGITRNYGGNGLGLSIVKAYINLLKGAITLKSEINKGTTVHVSIPTHKSNLKNIQLQSIKTGDSLNKILIAEDEYSNYLYLSELLNDTNLEILYAANGQQAIDLCRSNQSIELVLMDIKMPIMDGVVASKQIKSFRPDLPIIAQTAYALENEKTSFISDFDDYITKPINEEEFKQKLKKYYKS